MSASKGDKEVKMKKCTVKKRVAKVKIMSDDRVLDSPDIDIVETEFETGFVNRGIGTNQ